MMSDIKKTIYQSIGKFEDTRFEKIHNITYQSSQEASVLVAQEIAQLIRKKQQEKAICVLGLATGSSPVKVYEELVRMHREEELSFKNVITFNLDEYYGMDKSNIQSYFYFMHEHLFNHVDILPENINIPDGTVTAENILQYCIDYEMKIKKVGGLDFQLLGIGRTGHIGFNEPGSHFNSETRIITLDHITRIDAAPSFKTSTLSTATVGIALVFTKALPSLAVAPVRVCLLPSTRINVDERPKPLKFTFEVPWVAPCVKESELFSDPELTDKFLVISAIVVAPISSIVSRSIISTGDAPSVALPLMYEPVTITSSTSC